MHGKGHFGHSLYFDKKPNINRLRVARWRAAWLQRQGSKKIHLGGEIYCWRRVIPRRRGRELGAELAEADLAVKRQLRSNRSDLPQRSVHSDPSAAIRPMSDLTLTMDDLGILDAARGIARVDHQLRFLHDLFVVVIGVVGHDQHTIVLA